MTTDQAKANYAAYVERQRVAGFEPGFSEDEWVTWQTKPCGYRGKDMGTGHENWLHNGYGHGIAVPAYEPGPGMDPQLFSGWGR